MLDMMRMYPKGMPDALAFPHIIGGSYVINPDAANDIDLYVPSYHEPDEEYIRNNGWRRLEQGDEKYPEIDNERLHCVYEKINEDGFKLNLIVVGACYWPAYVGAVVAMRANRELYQTRDERIALHKKYCSQIKDMIEGK